MKIKINEPCDADWNKMKIGMISRHCELCVKNVMDFTKMSREEILIYLFKNNNKSTCARMYGNQMDFHHQELEAIIEGTRKQKGNLPFVILSLASLALLSCDTNPVVGNIEHIPKTEIVKQLDTLRNQKNDSNIKVDKHTELGKIIKEEPKKQTCEPKKGEVDTEIIELMGDVSVPETGIIEMPDPEVMGGIDPDPFPEIKIGEHEMQLQDEKIYEIVEIMPEFIGGVDSLMSYLSTNIVYPKKALKAGIEGRVFVQFIVEKDGEISLAKVLRGVDSVMDNEALRVISSMPNWFPGKHNGKEVRTKFVIPVKFQLK